MQQQNTVVTLQDWSTTMFEKAARKTLIMINRFVTVHFRKW